MWQRKPVSALDIQGIQRKQSTGVWPCSLDRNSQMEEMRRLLAE